MQTSQGRSGDSATLRLLAGPLCNFSAKVRLALAEKGLAAEVVEVPYTLSDGYSPKHPEVTATNPKGTVPVLIAGELALYDSTVIIEYLEDRYPDPALYPRDAASRARCRQLEAEADELLWPLVRGLRAALLANDALATAATKREIDAFYGRLERRLLLGQEYLCRAFSAADIATWIFVCLLDSIDAGPSHSFEHSARWYLRVATRPAFVVLLEQRRAALDRLDAPPTRTISWPRHP